MLKRLFRASLTLLLALTAQQALAVCGGSLAQNSWGRPLDYRNEKDREALKLIEPFHFTAEVENLERGITSPLPADIHYVLMRFLNHPRALNSMANWQLKNGFQEGKQYFIAECYFERAIAFTPDDPMIYLVWGNYLFRKKDYTKALEMYKEAELLDPENAEVHYDMGLLYIELKDLDAAREQADRAYELGYPLLGLQHKLERLSKNSTSKSTAK